MPYRPHENLVGPARSRPEVWRTVVGFIVISSTQAVLIFAVYALAALFVGEPRVRAAYRQIFFDTGSGLDTLVVLGTYGFLIIGAAAVVIRLHGRPALSLIGSRWLTVVHFLRTLKALVPLYVVLWLLPDNVTLMPGIPIERWLLLLPVSLVAVLIQSSAEEILFRGYLQQQLAARFRSPLVWMGIPALLFAWGHYSAAEAGGNAMYAAIWAGFFALAAADLTARTGTLGAAIALHFINNVSAIVVVALPGALSGLAFYIYPFDMASSQVLPYFAIDLAVLGVSWLAARLVLRV